VGCDATLRYVAPINNQDVSGYTELDLRLGWRPAAAAWEISLTGQNLLHDQHAEFGAALSRREIERSVYAKIVWSF
jgi:iron complex outermembrane receptor protein